MNQGRTKGEDWSTANKVKSPSNFIADRLKAAPLFWFFSDFKFGVPLFIVILVIYKNGNGLKQLLFVILASGHLYRKLLFTWLSLLVSLMPYFCAVIFPRGVLDEIWDFIESVSEGFPTYCLRY